MHSLDKVERMLKPCECGHPKFAHNHYKNATACSSPTYSPLLGEYSYCPCLRYKRRLSLFRRICYRLGF